MGVVRWDVILGAMASMVGETVVAFGRLLRFAPTGLAALLRFALRFRPRHRRAFREALGALSGGVPSEHGEPFEQIHPNVLEIRRDYLRELGLPEQQPSPLTVIHLNGTGEPLHAILPGLQTVFSLQPQLAAHRHLLIDVPDAVNAFDGAEEFRNALRDILAPVLEGTHGGLLLIGLSRGGVAAMDLGATWVRTSRRAVGVLALSPPLIGDYERPQTVRDIACLEPMMAQLAQLAKVLPRWLLRGQDWLLRRSYLALTSFTLAEFEMDSVPVLRWAAWDLRHQDPIGSILRANREFAMLLRVSDRVLHDGCDHVARTAASHDGLSVYMLWGERDKWVPADRCAERARASFAAADVPAERVKVDVLPGWGHALSRQHAPDSTQLAECVAQLAARVATLEDR